jgi:outer membrane autotransporter protein
MGVAFSGNMGQLAQASVQARDAIAQYGGWVRGIGNFLSVHGQGSNPAFGSAAGGFLMGIDHEWGRNLVVGVAGGYSHAFLSQNDGSGGNIDTPRAMFYASYRPANGLLLDGVAGVAYDRISTVRPVTQLNANAKESHNGYEESLALQGGYAVPLGGNWTMVPRAGLQYLHLDQTSYNESGASGFDLSAPASHTNSLQPLVSISAFKPFYTDRGMRVVPEFKLAYSRELLSTSQTLSLTTPAGSLVPATGVSPAHNTLTLGPSVTAQITDTLDLYADYKLSLGLGKSIDHNIFAGARWSF